MSWAELVTYWRDQQGSVAVSMRLPIILKGTSSFGLTDRTLSNMGKDTSTFIKVNNHRPEMEPPTTDRKALKSKITFLVLILLYHTSTPSTYTSCQLFQWLLGCCAISTQNYVTLPIPLIPVDCRYMQQLHSKRRFCNLFSQRTLSFCFVLIWLKVDLELISVFIHHCPPLSSLQQFLSSQKPQCR